MFKSPSEQMHFRPHCTLLCMESSRALFFFFRQLFPLAAEVGNRGQLTKNETKIFVVLFCMVLDFVGFKKKSDLLPV